MAALIDDSAALGEQPQLSGPLDFFSLTRAQLAASLKEYFDLPAFRATQLFNWVYRQGQRDFSAMSNFKLELREQLAAAYKLPKAEIRSRQISSDGTRKYLFEVNNGDLIESVMIKQPNRMTLCVSSQVGCGMACQFCRTGTMGFKRHLTPSEIIRQVLGVMDDAKNFGDMFQNIVFMGMGEPLHNFDGIAAALSILNDAQGLYLGPRKITVSTVGLVPAIKRFGEEKLGANLAVSLNATTNEVRSEIMPINKRYPIEELLEALSNLPLGKRKLVTIEYVMLAGINDTKADMARLPKLLKGIPSKINLIPYNDNAGLGFKTPTREWVQEWRSHMLSKGVNATIRWSKGVDINAACGQLVTESKRQSARRSATKGSDALKVVLEDAPSENAQVNLN